MWQHYRKTLIPVQIFILTLALILRFWFKANIPTILVAVLTMEIMSITGAMWSVRLRRKIDNARGTLR